MLTPAYLAPDVPAVALFNNLESFGPYMQRSGNPALRGTMFDKGNRALLWLGGAKLVVLSAPAPHLGYLRDRAGYAETELLVTPDPSSSLCEDILRQPELLERLVAYAGPSRRLQLVPYATTPELYRLAGALRETRGIDVELPESPEPENLWVRDYMDTKAGFRDLAGRLLGEAALPEGFVCESRSVAAEAVAWLARRGTPAVVKASHSNGGFGHLYAPADETTARSAESLIAANPYFADDQLVVEERIASPENVFPAVEIYVPAEGEPHVTHVCQELFLHGKVTGQIVTPALARATWYASLVAAGLRIAGRLQGMGYRGLFDVDGVVDADGRLYLLEVNPRRTAGTHAHEFASRAFGSDYAERMTVICHNTLDAGRVASSGQLLALLDDLLYAYGGPPEGIVVTHTAGLREGEFGCLIASPSAERAAAIQDEMLRRVASA